MSTPLKLEEGHDLEEGAINMNDPLQVAIVKEAPDYAELMADRRKLLRKIDKFTEVTSVDDTPGMAEAKALRLLFVKNRTALDRVRKTVGDTFHRNWKATNDTFRPLLTENEQAEEYLRESEEFAIRYEASRIAELRAEREKVISPHLMSPEDLHGMDLGNMTESVWEGFLATFIAKKEEFQRQEKERQELERQQREADRIARQKAEQEAAQLREEKRMADVAAAAERQKHEKELRDIEAKRHAEQQKADQEARRLKAEADAKLADERRQREELEKKQREQEAAAAQRVADEKKAAARAAKAPDKNKLEAYLNTVIEVVTMQAPAFKNAEFERLSKDFQKVVSDAFHRAKAEAENL
jgi:hypothetical protein